MDSLVSRIESAVEHKTELECHLFAPSSHTRTHMRSRDKASKTTNGGSASTGTTSPAATTG